MEVMMLCFLKGGEIMHFRHFILMGVFLGAAVFLPNNAFAKKNGAASQPDPQNAAVQTLVSEKIKNPIASEKAVPVTPENVNKSKGGVVQKPVTNPSTRQTVPIKPVPKSPNQTNRGIEKAVPSLEKNMKAGESAESAAKVNDTGQTGTAKPNAVTNKLPKVPKSLSSKQTDSKAETHSQPPGLNAKSDTFTEDTDSSILIKTSSSLTLAQKPHIDEENQTPFNNRKIPWDIEIMNNPPQRTQSSGGQSNDQFSPGGGTISFITNWFYWDEHFALNLGQIYTSRQAKFCHQWINAPPSPPPKGAPFFLTFTANLATGNDN
jgi:hypothetical protein